MTLHLEPRDDLTPTTLWGLGRISHREAGIAQYVSQSRLTTFLYCLDTGVRITHKEFGGRALWGANFIDNSPVRQQLNTSRSKDCFTYADALASEYG